MRQLFVGGRLGSGVRGLLCVGLVLQSACGGSGAGGPGAQGPAGGDGNDGGLEAKFEREAEPTKKHVVRAGELFTAYIEASSEPKLEPQEGGLMVTADVGWESPVQCFVYEHAIDAGAAANTMLKASAKDVKFKALAAYFLDHQALDPVLGIRGVYQVEQKGTLLTGDFKLMVMPRSEHPMICWHDAPGYAKSFARVTTEFAKSFQFKSAEPKPMRGELWVVSLDGMPVGFSRDMTYAMDDGHVRRVSLGARFLPIAPGEMSFEDEVEVITTDKEGAISTGKYVSTENGETSLTVDIEKTKAGYNYVGTIQNKEVKGSFKSKQPLKSHYASEKKLKALAQAGKKAKFEQLEYAPSVDAAGGSTVTYEVTTQSDGMTVVSSMARRSVTLKANGRGVVQQAVMAFGAKKVEIDLVEQTGEL
jgi:hypothetical protein